MSYLNIFSFLAITFIGISCHYFQTDFDKMLETLLSHSVDEITVEELDSFVHKNDLIILDCREQNEFLVSHIPGAIHSGYNNFNIDNLKIDNSKTIIVYCSVGYRSEKIAKKLIESGYSNVKNLYGGIFKWKNSGKEVIDSNGSPTNKVHTFNSNWSKWLINGEKVY